MRVLFVVPGFLDSATARYRCGHLAEALYACGHQANIDSATENAEIRVEHDVVVLHRMGWSGVGQRLIAAARSIGAAVVYSADDLIFEPEYAYQVGLAHPDDPARYHYHRAEGIEARRCLLACDAAIVSTEFLAREARRALTNLETGEVKPVFVLRNKLGAEIAQLSRAALERNPIPETANADDERPGGDRVVLGYLSGSPTHDADLADIAPALAAVLARSPATRLLIVGPAGLPKIFSAASDTGQIRRHPFVPWRDLPGLLAGIDINLAPLDPTRRFNHAKSEVKFLEAAAVGVPTIGAAGSGFAEGVRDSDNCLLVRRQSDWEPTLWRLINDGAARNEIARNAHRFVGLNGTVAASTETVADTFHALSEFGRTGSRGGVSVRQPTAERIERAFRRVEEFFLRKVFRLTRHIRLLRGE